MTTVEATNEYIDFMNAVNGVNVMAWYPLTFRHFEGCKHLSEKRQLLANQRAEAQKMEEAFSAEVPA